MVISHLFVRALVLYEGSTLRASLSPKGLKLGLDFPRIGGRGIIICCVPSHRWIILGNHGTAKLQHKIIDLWKSIYNLGGKKSIYKLGGKIKST